MQISISWFIIPTIWMYRYSNCLPRAWLFLFVAIPPIKRWLSRHTCKSNTQVIMTWKGRIVAKGNSPRKQKPGDPPLTRGMCVGIAISMNTSLHVASALIYCQCHMLSFFLEDKLLIFLNSNTVFPPHGIVNSQTHMTADMIQVNSVSDITLICGVPHVTVRRMSAVHWQNCFGDKRGCPWDRQPKCSNLWLSVTIFGWLGQPDNHYYEPCQAIV